MYQPVLALILWTLVVFLWLYARRIPALIKVNLDKFKTKAKFNTLVLNDKAVAVADNYNHLHESPTIFYALAIIIELSGKTDALFLNLAWIYVALRIIHSLWQINLGKVIVRFAIFTTSGIIMAIMAIRLALLIW